MSVVEWGLEPRFAPPEHPCPSQGRPRGLVDSEAFLWPPPASRPALHPDPGQGQNVGPWLSSALSSVCAPPPHPTPAGSPWQQEQELGEEAGELTVLEHLSDLLRHLPHWSINTKWFHFLKNKEPT